MAPTAPTQSNSTTASGVPHLTRRNFVAGLAALGGATLVNAPAARALEKATDEQLDALDLDGGEWRTAGCWMTCHCGCINKAYVVDGLVVRQKTDDSHPDTPDFPQQRSCVKGHSLRQLVCGTDRLRYPMKRKHWEPGGTGDNSLRGRDVWERISWDEALDYIASEFTRIRSTYGDLSIASPSLAPVSILSASGGYTSIWGQQSQGGWALVGNTVNGSYGKGNNDRLSLRKAKLIVLWGLNPIYSLGGSNTHYLRQAKDAGAKVIVVDPWFSPSCQSLADEWVPVRPGTDGALLAAIAYTMIENGWQDQEFLDTHCVGFDADHMPEGEDGSENFKDYILGVYDGVPKTPEWASEICGTDPAQIRNLAEQMATVKPMTLKAGQAIGRTWNGAQTAHMLYTVGWMTGNVGEPGAEVGTADGSKGVVGSRSLVALGDGVTPWIENVGCTLPRGDWALEHGIYDPEQYYGIAYAEFWKAVLTGKHTDFTRGERTVNIKCLAKIGPSGQFNQNVDQTTAIEAYRAPGKVDFVVVSDFVMCPDAQFADIVLPIATPWERDNGYADAINAETVVWGSKIVEPCFEAKPDWWVDVELAKRLGIDPAIVAPADQETDAAMLVAEAQVMLPDGSGWEPLAQVSAEDIEKYGLTCEPHDGRVPLEELHANGGYQVPRSEGDALEWCALADFKADPEGCPVDTATGKLEIFSRALVERMDNYGTTPIDPIPKYMPAVEGYEETLADWKAKQKGAHPFQILGIHVARQAHSAMPNVKSLNEIFSNDLLMNPADAAAAGLESGQTAMLSNDHGQALRRVRTTPRVMPGVVLVGQGNWTALDEQTGVDRGCNVNTLTGGILVGAGQCASNTVLVNVEPWDGEPLEPDYLQPPVIPVIE